MNTVLKQSYLQFDDQNIQSWTPFSNTLDEANHYQLVPLGIALHHLLESEEMMDLFDNTKSLCLSEINQMIDQIEKQIDGVSVCNCQWLCYLPHVLCNIYLFLSFIYTLKQKF